ncbi:MAG: hypothetical protein LUD50_02845, partial [Clostridia bacterium]|nr:hypothetical protein [Clostridia bacterium]
LMARTPAAFHQSFVKILLMRSPFPLQKGSVSRFSAAKRQRFSLFVALANISLHSHTFLCVCATI